MDEAGNQTSSPVEAKPPEAPRKIAVIGEIPFAGAALTGALLAGGLSVRVLCPDERSEAAVRGLPGAHGATLETVRGSLDSVVVIAEVLAGSYGACFLSPITMQGRAYRAETHLQDVRRFLDGAEHAAIRKIVYHSALGAHPRAGARAVREAAEAEELVHGSRCEDFRVRTGPLMGCGDGFLTEIIGRMKNSAPVMGVMGYGSTLLQPLHAGDMARCVARMFKDGDDELRPGVYCLAGPETTTLLDLSDMAAEALGVMKLKLHVPLFILKLVATLRRGQRLEEEINLLFEAFCTDQNDAPKLLNAGEKLVTTKQAQHEILAATTA